MPLASEDFLVGDGVMSACEAASFCFFLKKKKNLLELKKTRKGGPDYYNLNATCFVFVFVFFWLTLLKIKSGYTYFYEI